MARLADAADRLDLEEADHSTAKTLLSLFRAVHFEFRGVREAAVLAKEAELRIRKAQLEEDQEELMRAQAANTAERIRVGKLKGDVAKDTAALNALRTSLRDAHKDAADSLLSVGMPMAQKIDELCSSLEQYSIQATPLESLVEAALEHNSALSRDVAAVAETVRCVGENVDGSTWSHPM
ncbi:hypothetical protein MFIFM68171_07004 [Madurella fahalii]|uniref:Uncharacterized protein n=1 Tax=Madurella fahalii TaxID=1157608 RepID=A0ABQ0GGA8_9PEZI